MEGRLVDSLFSLCLTYLLMVICVVKTSMMKKIFSLEIIFSIAIIIIGIRLGYVQILRNNILLNGASDSWQRSFPLMASRGYIYDRTGVALAIIPATCVP